MSDNSRQLWEKYCASELAGVTPLLTEFGISLDDEQPHLLGERYLMQAVTTESGKKIILLGTMRESGKRVVIKATSDSAGMKELEHERTCRSVITEIKFAYKIFLTPEELIFTRKNGFLISIQAFIEQDSTFLKRLPRDQFFFALRAFEAQEGAHATTYEHIRLIKRTFGSMDAAGYLKTFDSFKATLPSQARAFLKENIETIDQYGSFLTHTDFVPHNFRIVGEDMYLLDYSSLRFGNKYEGWARFLNFMTLYNRDLEQALLKYINDNRTPEESLSLKLMRVYRLSEIISYYTNAVEKSSDELQTLNKARVVFWTEALNAILSDHNLDEKIIEVYKMTRDSLRSTEEKIRQMGLH
jgi:hypothetical protein